MNKESLNGHKPLQLRPEDLTEGYIFGCGEDGEKNRNLTEIGKRLQGLFLQQENLGRILQDENISDDKYIEELLVFENKFIELEYETGKRISRDVGTLNRLRNKFSQIVVTRMDQLTNPNIVDKQRELVTIK